MSDYCEYSGCNQKFGIFNHKYTCSICGAVMCDDHVCNATYIAHFNDSESNIFRKVKESSGYLCPNCFDKTRFDLDCFYNSIFNRICNHSGCSTKLSNLTVTKVSCKVCGNWYCSDHAVELTSEESSADYNFPEAEGICGSCYALQNSDGGIETLKTEQEQDAFYKRIRSRIQAWGKSKGSNHKWLEYLLVAPDLFYLLCKLTTDKSIDVIERTGLVTATAYFILPLDILPEALLGPAGYIDDVALAAWVINSLLNKYDKEVVQKHWVGDGDALEVVQGIAASTDQMIGSGVFDKVKKFFTKQKEGKDE